MELLQALLCTDQNLRGFVIRHGRNLDDGEAPFQPGMSIDRALVVFRRGWTNAVKLTFKQEGCDAFAGQRLRRKNTGYQLRDQFFHEEEMRRAEAENLTGVFAARSEQLRDVEIEQL